MDTDEKEIIPITPGYYTVQIVDNTKVRIIDEGPFKGREIFCRLPTFTARIENEILNWDIS